MPTCTYELPQCWHRLMEWGCTCHIPKPRKCQTCGQPIPKD